jgi:hypothetical protein
MKCAKFSKKMYYLFLFCYFVLHSFDKTKARNSSQYLLLDPTSLLYYGPANLEGLGFLAVEVSRSHWNKSHSVRLPWTSDRPVADISTWQQTKIKIHRHPRPRRDVRTRNPSKRAATDPRPRPRGHPDRQTWYCRVITFFAFNNCFTCTNLCTALSLLKSLKTLLYLLKYHPTCFDPLGPSSGIPYYLLVELLDIKMYIKWCIWIKWCYVASYCKVRNNNYNNCNNYYFITIKSIFKEIL